MTVCARCAELERERDALAVECDAWVKDSAMRQVQLDAMRVERDTWRARFRSCEHERATWEREAREAQRRLDADDGEP